MRVLASALAILEWNGSFVTHYDLLDGLTPDAINAVVQDERFARLDLTTSPVICLAGDPTQIVFANHAALAFFGATDLKAISHIILKQSPSSLRLHELARVMRAGLPPRTERLRFFHGPHAEYVSYQFRRSTGQVPLLIMNALGVRISESDSDESDAHGEALTDTNLAASTVVSAPAPAPVLMPLNSVQSLDDLRLYHRQFFADAPSVRFLWQTDAEGRMTSITGQLCEAVGCVSSDLIGHSLIALLAQWGVDVRELTHAMHHADTFSGIEVLWPIASLHYAVPVSLGGIPSFDRQRQCDGFRGYGIVYVNAPQTYVRADDSNNELVTRDEADVCDVIPEPIGSEHSALEETGPEPMSMEHYDLGDNVVPLRLWQERAAAQQAAQDVSHAQDEAGSEIIAPSSDLSEPSSILPPEEETDVTASDHIISHDTPAVSDDEGDQLSPAERIAFREIARALGARTRAASSDAPPAKDNTAQKTQKTSAQATLRAERDQDMLALSANARHLIDCLPIGILVTRAEIPLFLNRTFLDLLGFADADAFHDAGGLDHLFRAGGVDPQADEGAIHITGKNGETIALECRVQRISWDDQPATLMSFRRAIEPEANALIAVLEAELSRTEAETRELHAILDTATDGVAVLDHKGRILSLNRAGEALFGFEQNEVAGESITSLLAPESHSAALDYLSGLQANGVASVLNDGREIVGRAKQGGSIPVFMTLGRLQAGGETKFCAVLRDMTPWKRAESELRDARREAERVSALKSDFLAKMSHEIRTPLNAILGFAEVIMEERFGPIGNERYKDYLKDIHASGAHVMSLINDLLDLSKIEAGKLELNFTSVEANRIVSESVNLMQPQANRERVIIRQSLAPHLPMIVADERALRQIVLNLVSNAIKFNEAGGQVIISTALTDAGHAVIRIRDTGIGMSESDVKTALEPFRQLATTRQTTGTGLGLPLTKALVEANRASFVIRSQKNNGTLVEVTFPPTRVLAE
jgi:PAS domain S-box-containing protein